jgi:hypothetical protein
LTCSSSIGIADTWQTHKIDQKQIMKILLISL